MTARASHLPPLTNDPSSMADHTLTYRGWQESAVHRSTTPDGQPVWLVNRYDDVRAALTDARLSLSKSKARAGYAGFVLPPALDANLLNMDPPDHTRLRRLVGKAFTARRVEQLRPRVQQVVDTLLDELPTGGVTDLIAGLAAPLPLTVIGDVLGVPECDREAFRTWTDVLIAPDPNKPISPGQAIANMERLLRQLVDRHRAEPDDTLLSAMVSARDDGDRLSEDELTSLAFLILWAGYEATVHLIGNGILTLLQHPEQAATLRSNPELLPRAVEELARFASPTPYAIRRFPTEDIEIGGIRIPAGETVLLMLTAANHDPACVDRPGTFDLARADNPHLSYGHGLHYCLGAPLARIEAGTAIGTLLRRHPHLTLAVPADQMRWQASYRTRGLLELPVHLDTASRRPVGSEVG